MGEYVHYNMYMYTYICMYMYEYREKSGINYITILVSLIPAVHSVPSVLAL